MYGRASIPAINGGAMDSVRQNLHRRGHPAESGRTRRRPAGRPRWALLPAGAAAAVTGCLLVRTGVSTTQVLVFGLYLTLGLVLPGTLAWRWLRRNHRGHSTVEDLVVGTTLAYAIELALFLPSRALGVPHLFLTWPALVIVGSLLSPHRKDLWAPRTPHRHSFAWITAMSAIYTYLAVWITRMIWRPTPLSGEASRAPYVDQPFELALIGELRHHFPAQIPYVAGEPLSYHWFVHAHIAASSWATGIEPAVLLERLSMLPMIAIVVAGVAVATELLTRRQAGGVLASVLLVLVGSFDPFGWTRGTPMVDERFATETLFLSPTQTFGCAIFVTLVILTIQLLSADATGFGWRQWCIVGGLMITMAGAKASLVPILSAALLVSFSMTWFLRRTFDRRALGLFALSLLALGFARLVLLGGSSHGLTIDLFSTSRYMATVYGLSDDPTAVSASVAVFVTVVALMSWLASAAGMVGLLVQGGLRDARATFLLGGAASAVGASFVFGQAGQGQLWFLRSAPLLIVVGSAWGLCRLLNFSPRAERFDWVGWITALMIFGGLCTWAVSSLGPTTNPATGAEGMPGLLISVMARHLLMVAVCLVVVALIFIGVHRRWSVGREVVLALILAMVLGLGLERTFDFTADTVAGRPVAWLGDFSRARQPSIGAGGVTAARWLRANSSPDDLVATNAHDRYPDAHTPDNRAFWISAYSERRVLVEGWGYSVRARELAGRDPQGQGSRIPFWDTALLEANDAAFRKPTHDRVRSLREEYGVDWMIVDRRFPARTAQLSELVPPRLRVGDYVIYQLAGE